MLKKDEIKVLKLLFSDLTRNPTIMDISKELKQYWRVTIFRISVSMDAILPHLSLQLTHMTLLSMHAYPTAFKSSTEAYNICIHARVSYRI